MSSAFKDDARRTSIAWKNLPEIPASETARRITPHQLQQTVSAPASPAPLAPQSSNGSIVTLSAQPGATASGAGSIRTGRSLSSPPPPP